MSDKTPDTLVSSADIGFLQEATPQGIQKLFDRDFRDVPETEVVATLMEVFHERLSRLEASK